MQALWLAKVGALLWPLDAAKPTDEERKEAERGVLEREHLDEIFS